MVQLLAKNSKAGCLFRPNFLKQVVIEIQKMEHRRQKFSKYSPRPLSVISISGMHSAAGTISLTRAISLTNAHIRRCSSKLIMRYELPSEKEHRTTGI